MTDDANAKNPEESTPIDEVPNDVTNDPATPDQDAVVDPPELVEPVVVTPVVPPAVPSVVPSEPVYDEVAEHEPEPAAHTEVVEPASTEHAAAAVGAAAAQQVVYVTAPVPPRPKGNRGFGILLALAATVAFAGLFALVAMVILSSRTGTLSFSFLSRPSFLVPVLFFAVGFVILVLLANRANWWAYILGSLFVGVLVYFGTAGTLLLLNGIVNNTPDEASQLLAGALRDPFIIAAALLGREVSMWVGSGIAARGRRVKVRNAQARADFAEQAERTRVERERAAFPAAPVA